MNEYYIGQTIGSILGIFLLTLLIEWAFARLAKIERSVLSAIVSAAIAYILAGVLYGLGSDGDFFRAYLLYLPGFFIVALLMTIFRVIRARRKGRRIEGLRR
jgi:hypothetical protein